MSKVFAYCRVSTLSQVEKGNSIEFQTEKCKAWAAYKYPNHEIEVLQELAISGNKPLRQRPKGQYFFGVAKEGDVFVSLKYDRAFRNVIDALQVSDDLKAMGIGLVLLNISDGDVVKDSNAKMIFTVLIAVAESERETTKLRTMEGKAQRATQGDNVFLGGRVPYGFMSVPDPDHPKGKIKVPNPEHKPVIDEIMRLRKSGISIRDVLAEIESQGHQFSYESLRQVLERNQT